MDHIRSNSITFGLTDDRICDQMVSNEKHAAPQWKPHSNGGACFAGKTRGRVSALFAAPTLAKPANPNFNERHTTGGISNAFRDIPKSVSGIRIGARTVRGNRGI